jgi:hypothetical protein
MRDATKTFSQYTANLAKIYGLNPLSPIDQKLGTKYIALKTPNGVSSPFLQNDPTRGRNCFVMSQSPKRATLKSYQRVVKPVKPKEKDKNSTFSTVEKDDEDEQYNVPAPKYRFGKMGTNPLRNDIARDILHAKEKEEMYKDYLNQLKETEAKRRSIDFQSNYLAPGGLTDKVLASENSVTVSDDGLQVKGERL